MIDFGVFGDYRGRWEADRVTIIATDEINPSLFPGESWD